MMALLIVSSCSMAIDVNHVRIFINLRVPHIYMTNVDKIRHDARKQFAISLIVVNLQLKHSFPLIRRIIFIEALHNLFSVIYQHCNEC